MADLITEDLKEDAVAEDTIEDLGNRVSYIKYRRTEKKQEVIR